MAFDIDKEIEELVKKADAAQKAGDYELMKEYDMQLQILRNEKFQMLKSVYSEETEVDKPKTR